MAVSDYFPSEEELMIRTLRERGAPIRVPDTGRISRQLNPYNAYNPEPQRPSMGDRPNVSELYKQMETLYGTPIDYSALERVNKGRAAQSQTDMGAGLAMSMLGGKTMKPAGGQVFKQALEMAEPLRANLADVGYVDPESGQFVENPMVERQRREKILGSRIDAINKEENQRALMALGQNRQGNVTINNSNSDALRAALAEAAQLRAEAAARNAGNKGNEPPAAVQKAYAENQANLTKVDEAIGLVRANPDAVGKVAMLPGWAAQYVPGQAGEGGVTTRAMVSDLGSLKIHQRSGAAVTAAEFPRLRPFIPNPAIDSPKTIADKLENFRKEYANILELTEAGYPASAIIARQKAEGERQRSNLGGGAAPAAGAGAARVKVYNPTTGRLE